MNSWKEKLHWNDSNDKSSSGLGRFSSGSHSSGSGLGGKDWTKDFPGLQSLNGKIGSINPLDKKKDEEEELVSARPLSALRDPSSFPPPPRRGPNTGAPIVAPARVDPYTYNLPKSTIPFSNPASEPQPISQLQQQPPQQQQQQQFQQPPSFVANTTTPAAYVDPSVLTQPIPAPAPYPQSNISSQQPTVPPRSNVPILPPRPSLMTTTSSFSSSGQITSQEPLRQITTSSTNSYNASLQQQPALPSRENIPPPPPRPSVLPEMSNLSLNDNKVPAQSQTSTPQSSGYNFAAEIAQRKSKFQTAQPSNINKPSESNPLAPNKIKAKPKPPPPPKKKSLQSTASIPPLETATVNNSIKPPLPPAYTQTIATPPLNITPVNVTNISQPVSQGNGVYNNIIVKKLERKPYVVISYDLELGTLWYAMRPIKVPPCFNGWPTALSMGESSSISGKRCYVILATRNPEDLSVFKLRIDYDAGNPGPSVQAQRIDIPPPPEMTKEDLETASKYFGNGIATWAESKKGTQVGNGECWTLAYEATVNGAQGCMHSVGYTHGALIYQRIVKNGENIVEVGNDVLRRGDIIQFKEAHFRSLDGMSEQFAGSPDHTSIITKIVDVSNSSGREVVEVVEQNVRNVKTVQVGGYNFGTLVGGEIRVYRPLWAQWAGDASATW